MKVVLGTIAALEDAVTLRTQTTAMAVTNLDRRIERARIALAKTWASPKKVEKAISKGFIRASFNMRIDFFDSKENVTHSPWSYSSHNASLGPWLAGKKKTY